MKTLETVPFKAQAPDVPAVSSVGTPFMFPGPVKMISLLTANPCSSTLMVQSPSILKGAPIASPIMAPEVAPQKVYPAGLGLTAVPYVVKTQLRPAERSEFLIIKTPLINDQWEATLATAVLLNSFTDVVQGICTGFDFGVPVHFEHTYIPPNHSSAYANPSVITQYI